MKCNNTDTGLILSGYCVILHKEATPRCFIIFDRCFIISMTSIKNPKLSLGIFVYLDEAGHFLLIVCVLVEAVEKIIDIL